MKYKIKLPKHIYCIWNRSLIENLKLLPSLYDDIEIIGQNDIDPKILDVPRREKASFININDKIVVIDSWDYSIPMINWLNGNGRDIKIDLILKIQYCPNSNNNNIRNVPISPWTMFHFKHNIWQKRQPEIKNRWLNTIKKYDIGFSGRKWSWRLPWAEKLKEFDNCLVNIYNKTPPGDIHHYLSYFTKFSSILSIIGKKDRNTDGKNRREVEAASIGMPLILNYKPHYLNQLKPDHHYFYVTKPEQLSNIIQKLNTNKKLYQEISNNLQTWWDNNASPQGVCKTFIQALKQNNII